MRGHRAAAFVVVLLSASLALAAPVQSKNDTASRMAAQRDAMKSLAFMDGAWRGNAWSLLPSGEKYTVTQTERVGAFLGNSVRVIEGRSYGDDGNVAFNAFGIISYEPSTKAWSMRSYALSFTGDFVFKPTGDGYTWEVPAGGITIRYTATIKKGKWHEVGDRITPGMAPERIFEMNLERIGDADWPAGGAVPMK